MYQLGKALHTAPQEGISSRAPVKNNKLTSRAEQKVIALK